MIWHALCRWRRFCCALAPLLAVLSLAALAHATPPDPSWIPGIYDDVDFDDVVTLLVTGGAAVDRGAPVVGRFALAVARSLGVDPAESAPAGTLRVPGDRAPPA